MSLIISPAQEDRAACISTKLPLWKDDCVRIAKAGGGFRLRGVSTPEQRTFCSMLCAMYHYTHKFMSAGTVVFTSEFAN